MQSIMTANIGARMNEGTNGSICQLVNVAAYVSTLVIVVIGKRMVDKIMPTSISKTSNAMRTADQNPSLLVKFSMVFPALMCSIAN